MSLEAGASLFEVLEALEVEEHPATSAPPAVARRLADLLASPRCSVVPEAWVEGPELALAEAYASMLDTGGEPVRRWWVRPALRADLSVGSPWLEHEGRRVARLTSQPGREDQADRELVWWDEASTLLLVWDGGRGVLVAYSPRLPGDLSFGYELGDDAALARAEWRLAGGEPAPRRATALETRATLGEVNRRCLLAPAPTRLHVDLAPLKASELHLAVGVLDHGFVLDDGRLATAAGGGDGVTFQVLVTVDGEEVEAWSRHVAPGEDFVEERVPLHAWRGRSVRLSLVAHPGPAGEASFDYALWSGLRLMGPTHRAPDRPHVVLVDVDTLRADRLGCYGHGRDTSPRLDAWAADQAVVFEDAVSANNWTLPSTASLLTGLSVSQHGVRRFPQRLSAAAPTLAQVLSAVGYETRARTDGGFVTPTFGFAEGFEVFDYRRLPWRRFQQVSWRDTYRWLRRRSSERPVFLFLQTYMVHAPYREDARYQDPEQPYEGPLHTSRVPSQEAVRAIRAGDLEPDPEDWRYLDDLYDAGVRRMDDVVGALVENLDLVFGGDPYLVIVTSDHGEEFGDHGSAGHGHTLYHELLHVPLIVRFPDGRAGRRSEPVSTLDVVPTVLAEVGLALPPHLSGLPLGGALPGERLRVAEHDATARAAYLGDRKLLLGAIEAFGERDELDRLVRWSDGDEQSDLGPGEAARRARLRAALDDWREAHPPLEAEGPEGVGVDEALIEQLKALGYLGDG